MEVTANVCGLLDMDRPKPLPVEFDDGVVHAIAARDER